MDRQTLEPGAEATIARTVERGDLASTLALDPDDAFPDVFATSRLVAVMELAAARVMRPILNPGELSVGVTIEITHSAATPPGATVRATARFLGQEGKLYVFEVEAHDDGGEIGRGTHKRAIIATERLVTGAALRIHKRENPGSS